MSQYTIFVDEPTDVLAAKCERNCVNQYIYFDGKTTRNTAIAMALAISPFCRTVRVFAKKNVGQLIYTTETN